MKKITTWMLAAILLCGSSVFIACSESDNPTPKKESKQRQEFMDYANNTLKNMAANTNFGGWEICNEGAKKLFKFVLDNDVFKTTLQQVMVMKMMPTIKPVEAGSELQQMGYTMSGEMDFVDFNTKFTVLDPNTVTVEESDGFEIESYAYNPLTGQMGQGLYRIKAKASGEAFKGVSKNLSEKAGMAIIIKFPAKMDIEIYSKLTGDWKKVLSSTIETAIAKHSQSAFFDYKKDGFSYTGNVESNIDIEIPKQQKVTSNSTLNFTIGQDPTKHEGNVGIAFTINGREMLNTSVLFGNVNEINWKELEKSESFVEFCTKLMQSVEMKNLTVSMMNDATMQMAITDCGEMVRLNAEMIYARNHGADEATIEEYTKQMNKLMKGGMITIGSLNMFLPLQLKTTLIGVDYNPQTAVKFVDENDYVAIVDLLDLQAMRYWTNIKEHTAAPMQQSVEFIMQLTGFVNEISGNLFQLKD